MDPMGHRFLHVWGKCSRTTLRIVGAACLAVSAKIRAKRSMRRQGALPGEFFGTRLQTGLVPFLRVWGGGGGHFELETLKS